ncbi:MAG: phage adaptor protein [Cetobacterium sp.]|uniref:phage adaptor protein n=1 Tax=Cetobacterium sp. TaxID=2071632 RepID=UPI003EE4CB66
MLDINTYGDLKRAVATWLNRRDSQTIDNIPMFINMAAKQFTRLAKLPYYEVLISLEAIDGFDFVNIPNDFLSAKHISVNGKPYNRVDLETYLRLKNKKTRKLAFARIGEQIKFIPALEKGDVVEMIYQRDIPEFKNDMDEPYSLLVASDIMLYLSLRHASIFLRDNDQEKYWMDKAVEAAESLMKQLDEAEWNGSSLVVPHFSY